MDFIKCRLTKYDTLTGSGQNLSCSSSEKDTFKGISMKSLNGQIGECMVTKQHSLTEKGRSF